jgi:hypothetical protein
VVGRVAAFAIGAIPNDAITTRATAAINLFDLMNCPAFLKDM